MGGNGVYFFEKEDYKLFLKKEKINCEIFIEKKRRKQI